METRIKQTAGELFKSYGIKSITMDDIAKKLGISKKTIYQYFTDKVELVSKTIQFTLEKEELKFQQNYLNAENAIDEILIGMESNREMLTNINSVLFYDLKKYYPEAWDFYARFKEKTLEVVIRNLNDGINQKLFRAEIKVDMLAKLRIETIDLIFNHTLFPASKYNLSEVQIESLELFLRGIVTPLGLEILEKRKKIAL